jgi:hypothetical protein
MNTQSTTVNRSARVIAAALIGVAMATGLTMLSQHTDRASGASQRDTGGVPQATCFWFGPATMDNPATNLAYPEESAIYWGARFRLPAGATLLLDGKYPHARFMSLNAYLDKGATDDLIDTEIKPSKGSVNPYKAGANRYAPKRTYRVAVPGPDTTPRGFANVLDSSADGTKIQELIYRVYMPDTAGDRSVGSLPKPSVKLKSGKVLRGTKACRAINDSQRYFTMQTMPSNVYTALVNAAGTDPASNPAQDPLRWEKYFNLPLALSIFSYGATDESSRVNAKALGEQGAYYDNLAVKYTVAPINQAFGEVLMLQGKLPTTPSSGKSVKKMGSGEMRFWSVCSNSSPVETRGVDCVNDAQLKGLTDAQRNYTIVVSRAADRPTEAVTGCKVAWLDWGDAKDILDRDSGTLILRNLASDPGFAHSTQKITLADVDVTKNDNGGVTTDNQRGVLGDYLPTGTYFADETAFDNSFDCAG